METGLDDVGTEAKSVWDAGHASPHLSLTKGLPVQQG